MNISGVTKQRAGALMARHKTFSAAIREAYLRAARNVTGGSLEAAKDWYAVASFLEVAEATRVKH